MIQTNLLAKQKETHRLGEQTYGCWGEVTESLFCPSETITTFLIGYNPTQNKNHTDPYEELLQINKKRTNTLAEKQVKNTIIIFIEEIQKA